MRGGAGTGPKRGRQDKIGQRRIDKRGWDRCKEMVYNMINSKITRYNTEEKREKKREERRCYDAM